MDQEGKAGKDWYYNFMQTHPELSLHTPGKLAKNWDKMTNESFVAKFYDAIEPTVTDNGVSCTPETIFNGMSLVFHSFHRLTHADFYKDKALSPAIALKRSISDPLLVNRPSTYTYN